MLNQAFAKSTDELIKSAMDSLYQSPSRDWIVSNQYSEKETGLTHAYIQQSYHGIPIYNAISILVFKNDKTVYYKSGFLENIKMKVNSDKPAITPLSAVDYALKHLGLASDPEVKSLKSEGKANSFLFESKLYSTRPVKVELVYAPVSGNVMLAWNVSIELKNKSNWWNIRIDASSGRFLDKNDYVAHCSFDPLVSDEDGYSSNGSTTSSPALPSVASSYRVFPLPIEAPTFGSRVLLIDPANIVASPYGWHDINGVAGAEYTITRGNNVYAYEDIDNDDLPGYSPDGGAGFTFDFPYNSSQQPIINEDAALTNLFYVNNSIHDILFDRGFNGSAGNFQQNNYGGGGAGNDPVLAEGFDGGGTDNANFATPPDGYNPRMQMYLWTGASCGSIVINSPGTIAGSLAFGGAGFNPIPSNANGDLILVNDGSASPTRGCLSITNIISGKIAVIDRGTCAFVSKVLNAQAAGAIGVIIVNNQPTGVFSMGGFDPSITIPSVMISQSDGTILKNALLSGTVNAAINICTPINTDASFDNGVIAHEYGHGVSNRLTGGPANTGCLGNGEQAGEGWSDWLALLLTIEPGDHGSDARGIASYLVGTPVTDRGIRTFPYSTDMNINPHTYADLVNSPEVHYIGEIWCSAVWDLSWLLIDQYGFSTNPGSGNNIALRLILEGMKLQPCGPGFLDSRDAILQADYLLYDNAHRCMIWQAFSRRGMGGLAQQGSADIAGDETADFSMPAGIEAFVTGGGVFCRPQDALLDAGPGWASYDWGNNIHTRTFVPTTFGTQTVTVTGIGCSLGLESGVGHAIIRQSFDPIVSATPPIICPGGSSQLNATASVNIGNDVLTNSYYSSPAPYGNIWTSHHEQYLLLASELTGQGLVAGNINSLGFYVVQNNSGPGSQNLKISLANTAASNLTSTFINSGFSQVFSTPLFSSVPGWNKHIFNTPYFWNGVSNIVVDISLMNCTTCPAVPCVEYYYNDVVRLSNTSFNSCTYTFDDNNCTVPSFTPTSTVYVGQQRPNMLIGGNQLSGSFIWTPTTFLNNAAISNPLASNVTSATTYTVTATKANGCYGTASQNVDLYSTPATPAVINGRISVCKGQSGVTYCIETIAGATSYIWTLPAGATGSSTSECITVNFSTKYKGGAICVKAINPCFQSLVRCLNVSVQNSTPSKPGAISGPVPVCLPSTNVYCISPVATADDYYWSVTGNGGSFPMQIIYGQGSTCVYVDFPLGYNGNQKLLVQASNCKGMGPENKIDLKIISTPAMPGSISGPTPVCKSKTKNYSVANVNGASTYTWSVTGGALIQSGQGTKNVSINFNTATAATAVLSVYAENTCGLSPIRSMNVAVTLNCKLKDGGDEASQVAILEGLSSFIAYPNPTAGKITLSFNSEKNVKFVLKVVDILGHDLIKDEIDAVEGNNTKNLDLSNVAKGMYFVSIFAEGREVQTLRIVVE